MIYAYMCVLLFLAIVSDPPWTYRARLYTQGFQETEEIPSDSPTVDEQNIRVLLLWLGDRI